jgi:hypothetical protein
VAHPQTDGGRITDAHSFLFRNEAASYGANETDSSSFSAAAGKRQRFTLHTSSSLFLIRNKALAAIAAAHREEEEEEQTPKGSRQGEAASTG